MTEISEEQAELNLLVHGLGFDMKDFIELTECDLAEHDGRVNYNPMLIKFAEALITIQNLTLMVDKHKEDVDALNLRLDLMNVPRDCTENIDSPIIT